MNPSTRDVPPGLHLVSTPIGNARDITLRALDVLAGAEVLAAEDTRSLRRLMDIHGIALGDRPLISYHDHNGPRARPALMAHLAAGRSVAYASEAGTPLIADPGFDLVRAARAEGLPVSAAPGVSAVITALSISGLASDRFLFAGFLPNARGQRKSSLLALRDVPATLIFYESPKRVAAMLADAAEVLGAGRQAVMCRELTKKFEECARGPLSELQTALADRTLKGEVVVLIDRAGSVDVNESEMDSAILSALDTMSVRDAAGTVAEMFGLPRRPIYQRAMELARDRADDA